MTQVIKAIPQMYQCPYIKSKLPKNFAEKISRSYSNENYCLIITSKHKICSNVKINNKTLSKMKLAIHHIKKNFKEGQTYHKLSLTSVFLSILKHISKDLLIFRNSISCIPYSIKRAI